MSEPYAELAREIDWLANRYHINDEDFEGIRKAIVKIKVASLPDGWAEQAARRIAEEARDAADYGGTLPDYTVLAILNDAFGGKP